MKDTDRLGTVTHDGVRLVLRYVRHLNHPPARVWRALTTSADLRHWMPTDIIGERRAGAQIELPFWSPFVEKYGIDPPVLPGEIRVWEPPKVFEWTWDTDLLRWELEPTADGTRLTFTTWLGEAPQGSEKTAGGYHACLDALEARVDGTPATPLIDADTTALEAHYKDLIATQIA